MRLNRSETAIGRLIIVFLVEILCLNCNERRLYPVPVSGRVPAYNSTPRRGAGRVAMGAMRASGGPSGRWGGQGRLGPGGPPSTFFSKAIVKLMRDHHK